MFSALIDLLPLRSRPWRIFFFFLLFWCCAGVFLFVHTLVIKNGIRQQSVLQVEHGLSHYLVKNQTGGSANIRIQADIPRELDFIRLLRGREQLLLTNTTAMNFSGLVDIDPAAQGVWIDLLQPDMPGNWILRSKTLADGSTVQGGFNDASGGVSIYTVIYRTAWNFFFAAGVVSVLLAVMVVYMLEAPLRTLQKVIEQGLETKELPLSGAGGRVDTVEPIYRLVEKIFYQNRQLIQEMQASLDNVAHDLRTPMTRLRAGAEYALQSDTRDPEKYRAALSDCLEESERVLSMLKVMMSVAEADAGTMRLELQEFSLLESLEDVVGLYQYVAEEEQIHVSCECAPDIMLNADKMRITQVWANLLDNAIKYGTRQGKVVIRAVQKEKRVEVSFSDNGMGISPSELNRIWDRLYRGDRSRTKQGLGLGLNYVKAVVEAHDGVVQVSSTIREGACFTVSLPLQN